MIIKINDKFFGTFKTIRALKAWLKDNNLKTELLANVEPIYEPALYKLLNAQSSETSGQNTATAKSSTDAQPSRQSTKS